MDFVEILKEKIQNSMTVLIRYKSLLTCQIFRPKQTFAYRGTMLLLSNTKISFCMLVKLIERGRKYAISKYIIIDFHAHNRVGCKQQLKNSYYMLGKASVMSTIIAYCSRNPIHLGQGLADVITYRGNTSIDIQQAKIDQIEPMLYGCLK